MTILGPREAYRLDAEPLCPHRCKQRPFRAHAHHLVPARTDPSHQRQQELPQREIDICDLDDFHVSDQ